MPSTADKRAQHRTWLDWRYTVEGRDWKWRVPRYFIKIERRRADHEAIAEQCNDSAG